MRTSILDSIVEAFNYRNELNQPLYTTVVGLLFSDEKSYIENHLGFRVDAIGNTNYNKITFYKNFLLNKDCITPFL